VTLQRSLLKGNSSRQTFKPNYYGNRVVIRKRKPIAEFLSLTRPLRIHTYLNYGVISELSEPLYAFAY